jgi:hypothetical protein
MGSTLADETVARRVHVYRTLVSQQWVSSRQVCVDLLMAKEIPSDGKKPRKVTGVKDITSDTVMRATAELSTYRRLAAAGAVILAQADASQRPAALWRWWWSIRAEAQAFFFIAHRAVLW